MKSLKLDLRRDKQLRFPPVGPPGHLACWGLNIDSLFHGPVEKLRGRVSVVNLPQCLVVMAAVHEMGQHPVSSQVNGHEEIGPRCRHQLGGHLLALQMRV